VQHEVLLTALMRSLTDFVLKTSHLQISCRLWQIGHVGRESVVANVCPRDAFCRTRWRCSEVLNSCSLFVAVDVVFILSPFVRVLRKSNKCAYEGIFLSGRVQLCQKLCQRVALM
jgi:hypothetical protein